jgi:anti-sigma28 factor (negative regulator of flagellin synthesis)
MAASKRRRSGSNFRIDIEDVGEVKSPFDLDRVDNLFSQGENRSPSQEDAEIEESIKLGRRAVKINELAPHQIIERRNRIDRLKNDISKGNYSINGSKLFKAIFC